MRFEFYFSDWKIPIHQAIGEHRKSWFVLIPTDWILLRLWKPFNESCHSRRTNRIFNFNFEIKMWIRPSREKIVEHREDSYSRYTERMENAQKRIEEKNIVLWDFVICTRRLNWIVQREWQFTWEIVKQYEYWNIRYYVEFVRNWMKRTYPISIDEIKKV